MWTDGSVSGGNYQVDIGGGIARARVWRRPDVDSATGARWALELRRVLVMLARGAAKALILDLREAPPVQGPTTQGALAELLGQWEQAGRPLALVAAGGMQRLQMARLVREHAPAHARLHEGTEEAERWVAERLGGAKG